MKLDTSSYYPKSSIDDSEYTPATGNEVTTEPAAETPASSTPDLPPTELESVITAVAHVLSWVFVPLLMPVYAALLAFDYTVLAFTGLGTRLVFTLIIFLFNVAVPSALVLLLKKFGLVQDVGLNNQKERFLPYLICILCLIGTALFLGYKNAPSWMVMFYMGGAAAGIVEVIINRWWKISVHAAGIAGIVALLTYLMLHEYSLPGTQTWLIIAISIAGLLGSARVWLGRHTVWQVLAGYAVGFAGVYLMMLTASAPAA